MTTSSATISDDGRYRYDLVRRWDDRPLLVFVMLNPSTADASVDDRTIGRCRGFAQDLGHGGILVVNAYAYRATDPRDLWAAQAAGVDVVGPRNDLHLVAAFDDARIDGSTVIAAWGAHARPDRVAQIRDLAALARVPLTALRVTKTGAPGHPLYLPATLTPQPWEPAA